MAVGACSGREGEQGLLLPADYGLGIRDYGLRLRIRDHQRITDYSRPGGNLEVAIGRVREHGEAVREGW